MKAHRTVKEYGKELSLTPLGEWVASSKLSTIFERERFTSLICTECSSPLEIVLLNPLIDTMEVNAKGTLFMDFICPRCKNIHERLNLSGIAKKSEFVEFYDRAVVELQRSVKIEAQKI